MDNDENVLLTDAELETFVSENQELDFIREMLKESVPTSQENREMFAKYIAAAADSKERIEMQNMLTRRNLRLIVSIAKKKLKYATSYKLLDLVNEGVAGFIKNLHKFDINGKAALSTYMIFWISQAMDRALQNNDKAVRRPVHFSEDFYKYRRLVNKCAANGEKIPVDQELADILGVTLERAQQLQNDYKLDASSINVKLESDEDSEVGNFLGSVDTGYDAILDEITSREMMIFLKDFLPKREYFILYYSSIADIKRPFRELAEKVGVSRQACQQILAKTLNKIRPIFANDKVLARRLADVRSQYDIDEADVYPIDTGAVVFFYFICDKLNFEEKELYKSLVLIPNEHDMKKYVEQKKLSLDEYKKIYDSLSKKVNLWRGKQYREFYLSFKRTFIVEFGEDLGFVDFEATKPIFYRETVEYWNQIAQEDLRRIKERMTDLDGEDNAKNRKHVSASVNRLLLDAGESIPSNMKNLIRRYFTFIQSSPITMEEAEREVNAISHGYKDKAILPLNVLYETAVNNRSKIPPEQYDYMMAYMFGKAKKRDFNRRYPNSNENVHSAMLKLEKLYFDLPKSYFYNFTRDKYLVLRESCLAKGLESQIEVLDMFFGVGIVRHSIEAIAKKMNVSFDEANYTVAKARENCLSCYLKRGHGLDKIDKELYIFYLKSDEYELKSPGREMALEYLESDETYEAIGAKRGYSFTETANRVYQVLRQIDLYRFGISIVRSRYSVIIRNEVLESGKFSLEESAMITECLAGGRYSAVGKNHKIDEKTVKKMMTKFYNHCYRTAVKGVTVTREMVEEEVTRHPTDTILDDKFRGILAFLYGIKCDINSEGKTYSPEEVGKMYDLTSRNVLRRKRECLDYIAARSIGLVKPNLGFMERTQLEQALKNPCLPLTARNREIMCHYFEFHGYARMSIDELAVKYERSAYTIRDVIKMAFVTIFKFELGEIDEELDFDEHIAPYLKYFSKSDQAILIDRYRDECSYNEISRRRGISSAQSYDRIYKLSVHLNDMLEGRAPLFDFDHFESHVFDEDIPFYGDKESAYKAWWMFYEEKRSADEIIESMGLNIRNVTLFRDMDALMCAVLKRKMGIKKTLEFSYEDIREYYLRSEGTMSREHKLFYYHYFERKAKWKDRRVSRTTSDVSTAIMCDLLKDRGVKYIYLDDMTKAEALNFIRKHRHIMSQDCVQALAYKFGLQGKDFMSGSDQNKVIRALSNIESNQKVLNFAT